MKMYKNKHVHGFFMWYHFNCYYAHNSAKTYLFNRIFTSNEIVDVKHFRTFLRNIMYFNGINSFITAYCMHHLKYAKWETKGFSFVITSYQTIQIPFKNLIANSVNMTSISKKNLSMQSINLE